MPVLPYPSPRIHTPHTSSHHSAVQSLVGPDVTEDIRKEKMYHQPLYLFLGQLDQFSFELKNQLQKEGPGLEALVEDVIEHAEAKFSAKQYLVPQQKHVLLKAMTLGLYLLDGPGERSIVARKRFRLDHYGNVISQNPCAHIFGDLSIQLSMIFQKCPNLKNHAWNASGITKEELPALACAHELKYQVAEMGPQFRAFLFDFKEVQEGISRKAAHQVTMEHCEAVYAIVFRGLRLLATLSNRVLDSCVWKYCNPNTTSTSQMASAYEQAVRYNYDKEDKEALITFIVMVKDTSDLLLQLDPSCLEAISKYMASTLQGFLTHQVLEFISQFAKKKRPMILLLQHIQAIGTEMPLEGGGDGGKKGQGAGAHVSSFSPSQVRVYCACSSMPPACILASR
jgi:cytoplasmic FMR1 interacting protein